jgi:hypothetical protein
LNQIRRRFGQTIVGARATFSKIGKLDPADVLTTAQSRKLLDPLIRPLPSFDKTVLGGKGAA